MREQNKVISFKERRMEKKYGSVYKKRKYGLLLIAVPVLISSIVMLDRHFNKVSLANQGIEYKPYYETHKEYIMNETEESKYKELKRYYIFQDKLKTIIAEYF